jgi:hypothetical protein
MADPLEAVPNSLPKTRAEWDIHIDAQRNQSGEKQPGIKLSVQSFEVAKTVAARFGMDAGRYIEKCIWKDAFSLKDELHSAVTIAYILPVPVAGTANMILVEDAKKVFELKKADLEAIEALKEKAEHEIKTNPKRLFSGGSDANVYFGKIYLLLNFCRENALPYEKLAKETAADDAIEFVRWLGETFLTLKKRSDDIDEIRTRLR